MAEPAAGVQWASAPQQAEELLAVPQAQHQQQPQSDVAAVAASMLAGAGPLTLQAPDAAAGAAPVAGGLAFMGLVQQQMQAMMQQRAEAAAAAEDGLVGNKRKPWSDEEDKTIMLLVDKVGGRTRWMDGRMPRLSIHTTLTDPTQHPQPDRRHSTGPRPGLSSRTSSTAW